jgi:hypothetical protein
LVSKNIKTPKREEVSFTKNTTGTPQKLTKFTKLKRSLGLKKNFRISKRSRDKKKMFRIYKVQKAIHKRQHGKKKFTKVQKGSK